MPKTQHSKNKDHGITSWQIDREKVTDFSFLCSKIIVDGYCSHKIKRCLLLGRKDMINLDSVLKSRDIILPAKVCLVKAMIFPIVMYGWASQVALVVKKKNPPADAGDTRDMGSIRGLGRSPGEGHSNLLQYSCLENPMDKGDWQATVHSVTKTQLKRLSMHVLHACTDVRVGPQRRLSTKELMLSITVLEKTLDGPLASKEVKPLKPKENQP